MCNGSEAADHELRIAEYGVPDGQAEDGEAVEEVLPLATKPN